MIWIVAGKVSTLRGQLAPLRALDIRPSTGSDLLWVEGSICNPGQRGEDQKQRQDHHQHEKAENRTLQDFYDQRAFLTTPIRLPEEKSK